MSEPKYDQGGWFPGTVEVLVIPYADREKPLPAGWDPLRVIQAEECIIKPHPWRCVRADHPHGVTE
jgi:hypothetical protein